MGLLLCGDLRRRSHFEKGDAISRHKTTSCLRARAKYFIALGCALLVLGGSVTAATDDAAWAAEYPTWSQVESARASEAATQKLVEQIRAQAAALKSETVRTSEIAAQRGDEYEKADSTFQEAAARADRLRGEAESAQSLSKQSRISAGRIAAQMARVGGGDGGIVSRLLSDSSDAGDLLSQLGYASRIMQSAEGTYARAIQEQNNALALTRQADVARDALSALRLEAELALADAQKAEEAASKAMAAQTVHQAELEAQLSVLTQKRAATERDFKAGEVARAAEEAARAARAAGPAGQVSKNGWAKPTSGRVTSPFGWRLHPVYKTYRLHSGIDLAGGCNVPIYAATSGRVIYSGFSGGYGNWILLDHGNGVQTGYAHIIDGGRLVSSGQSVSAGQMIARTGNTGASTGCHLHFEVRPGGEAVDPRPFLQERGITLG